MLKIEVTQGDIDLTKEVVTWKTIFGGQIEITFKNNKGCEPFVSFDGNYLFDKESQPDWERVARSIASLNGMKRGELHYWRDRVRDLEEELVKIKTKTEGVNNNDN